MVAIFSHGICSAVKGSWYNSNSYKRSWLKQKFESRQLQSVKQVLEGEGGDRKLGPQEGRAVTEGWLGARDTQAIVSMIPGFFNRK